MPSLRRCFSVIVVCMQSLQVAEGARVIHAFSATALRLVEIRFKRVASTGVAHAVGTQDADPSETTVTVPRPRPVIPPVDDTSRLQALSPAGGSGGAGGGCWALVCAVVNTTRTASSRSITII